MLCVASRCIFISLTGQEAHSCLSADDEPLADCQESPSGRAWPPRRVHRVSGRSRLALLYTEHECRWRLSVNMASVQKASKGVLLLETKPRAYSSPKGYMRLRK